MDKYKKIIIKHIQNSEIVKLQNPTNKSHTKYSFQILPFGERGSYLSAELLVAIKEEFKDYLKKYGGDFEQFLTLEPGGNQWALLLASELKKDLFIVRCNAIDNTKVSIQVENNYSTKNMYFPSLPNRATVLIDDVLSTGSTLESAIEYYNNLNIKISAVFVIYTKGVEHKEKLDKYKIPIFSIIKNNEV